ncbi:MAG: phage holin family protein [Chloroflexota bacterium]|nr:MAG: phage holin family protein [Chloroflexota bacterium]
MPQFEMRHLPLGARVALMWLAEALVLGLLLAVLSGVTIESWPAGAVVVLGLGLLNALLRPILVSLSIRPTIWVYGLLTWSLDAGLLWLAGRFLPGIAVDGVLPPLLVGFGMGVFTVSFGDLLAIDDDDAYYHHVVRNIVHFYGKPEQSQKPGVLFLEIDGLSERILRQAMAKGLMPTLKGWLDSGSHRLIGWECDLSSQTSASQAGILLGSNHDIPAFRWYEKDRGKQMVSNHPADTLEIERRLSNGDGLLAEGGASRSNLFSGDANHTMFTFSTISNPRRHRIQDFYPLWMGIYNILRLLLLFGWDIVLEWRAAAHQRRHDVRPRMHRGGVYPLLRAATTVLFREVSLFVLIGDMYAGVPAAYTTFFGYDEVAHHSGIAEPDVLDVLKKIDEAFHRLQVAAKQAPRPYHFVVLSDHGQSQGATFKQRYGLTLKDLVCGLTAEQHTVESIESESAGWANLNLLLTGLIRDFTPNDKHFASRLLRRGLKNSYHLGQVMLGPARRKMAGAKDASQGEEAADVVVLASGNLGLVYFTDWPERMTLEQINAAFPGLIQGMVEHEGVGFVLVRSEAKGPLAIGATGTHHLANGQIEGDDPLTLFGPNAAAHLCRTDSFPHVADIMVNSLYDPESREVAAFEELVGSHGGLGGDQNQPFVLFPAEWQLDNEEIVGAAELHTQFKCWLADCSATPLPRTTGIAAVAEKIGL